MRQHNRTLVAQTLAKTIAASNAEAEELDRVYMFVDPDTSEVEITNTDNFSSCSLLVGPLIVKGLTTIDDADGNYALNLIIEIIE